jgi:hypothetical protein
MQFHRLSGQREDFGASVMSLANALVRELAPIASGRNKERFTLHSLAIAIKESGIQSNSSLSQFSGSTSRLCENLISLNRTRNRAAHGDPVSFGEAKSFRQKTIDILALIEPI